MTYPANYSLNQQIRHVLYALKRQYGGTVTVYQNETVATDTKTGEVTRTKTVTLIHRAVVLPVTISRELKQSISVISANKMTVMGGNFEIGKRLFIIERRDAPNLVLQECDWIGYNGRRYAIENFEEYEFDAAYIVTGKEMPGEILIGGGSIVEEDGDTMINDNAWAIVIGTPVYVKPNGRADKAGADIRATVEVFGLVKDTLIPSGVAGMIQTHGTLLATMTEWDAVAGTAGGLTPGRVYYLDATVAGKMTEIAPSTPGQFVARLGIALSATQFDIDTELPIRL